MCACAAASLAPSASCREIECVVHRARRMGLGNVERGEIVPVVLDFRTFGDGKAHIGEDFGQLVHHLADRVHRPLRRSIGAGNVMSSRSVARRAFSTAVSSAAFLRGKRIGYRFAQAIDQRTSYLPLFGRHAAHAFSAAPKRCLVCQAQRCGRLPGLRATLRPQWRRSVRFVSVAMSVISVRLHKQKGANGKCRPRPFAHYSKLEV